MLFLGTRTVIIRWIVIEFVVLDTLLRGRANEGSMVI